MKMVTWYSDGKGNLMSTSDAQVPNSTLSYTCQPVPQQASYVLRAMEIGEAHILDGIVIGTLLYLALYFGGYYEFAMILFLIMMTGIFVDLFIHDYVH